MLLVSSLRRILPMVSQLRDLLSVTPIGLSTMLTLKVGSSAGLSSADSAWSASGLIFLVFTGWQSHRAPMMKTFWGLRMVRLILSGSVYSGILPTKFTDSILQPCRGKSSFIRINLMTPSWPWRPPTTTRTHTPQTDTTRDGDICRIWEWFEDSQYHKHFYTPSINTKSI